MVESLTLNTGANIPATGFGTWHISLNSKAKKTVIDALHAGYRLIDTAKIYGNEKGVGAGIRESGLTRESIFVTTKLWAGEHGYESALRAFENSRGNLGLDYIDLYLIHWPGSDKRKHSWQALEKIYQSDRVKAIGVSNYTVNHLKEMESYANVMPAINQIEFHPLVYDDQKAVLEYCEDKGIIVEAYSPLIRGHINIPLLQQVGDKYDKTGAQVVLRWCIQHGTLPIPKTSHTERMHENLDIFDFTLSDEDMNKIDSLSNGTRTTWDPTNIA